MVLTNHICIVTNTVARNHIHTLNTDVVPQNHICIVHTISSSPTTSASSQYGRPEPHTHPQHRCGTPKPHLHRAHNMVLTNHIRIVTIRSHLEPLSCHDMVPINRITPSC
ncbi:hypothetical protein C8R41DRAFT_852895 [Lentinula lateritia]|uniref:Uncharacterized protein n=1 Tax=Lentinula lateritia TaxID=40482 RepID=A0ABQ8V426_9AGAR|nr:hypothetical protein C8R41DRAFT_852895 [Lentinula lateritia]